MPKLISNLNDNNHERVLSELCAKADHIILVSPFLFDDFMPWISNQSLNAVKIIELITSLKPTGDDNLRKPASLLSFFRALDQNFPDVKPYVHINNDLHGKIYIFKRDNAYICGIITSANLTVSGLSRNHEWGLLIDDPLLLSELENEIRDALDYPNLSYELIANKLLPAAEHAKAQFKDYKKDINAHFQRILKHNAVAVGDIRNIAPDKAQTIHLKPIGHMEAPVLLEDRRPFRDTQTLYFPKTPQPKNVIPRDIIISFGTGSRAVLCIHTVTSNVEELSRSEQDKDAQAERWPWFINGYNHTPRYGNEWWVHNITIDQFQSEYLNKYPKKHITNNGSQSLGAFNLGAGRVALDREFGEFIIKKIMELERAQVEDKIPQNLGKAFDKEMMNIYIRAKEEAGYTAKIFHDMLYKYRGVETAKRLIHSPTISEGYTALWKLGRLDLTVEALIFDNAKWQELFSEDEMEIIHKRLREYKYQNALAA